MPIAIKVQLQEEGVNTVHIMGTPQVPSLGDKGHYHWTLQDTYHICPLYQTRESWQLYLIHRNKHRRLPKQGDRNVAQMKEQIKTLEKEANKMEISNVSDAEFKTLFIRMLKELSEDLNSIKKYPVRNEGYTS